MYSYFSANAYPVFDYLEYPALLLQNWTLIVCHVMFNKIKVDSNLTTGALIYFLVLGTLCQGLLPLSVNQFLSVLFN